MEFNDRQLTCLDCSQPFVFTAGEQEFYERKGFREEPKRCKPCRESRKLRRPGMGEGGGGSRESDGNRSDGNRAAGGGRSRELFEATCASCGAQARVPFRPMAGRPVYCRDCYAQRGSARDGY